MPFSALSKDMLICPPDGSHSFYTGFDDMSNEETVMKPAECRTNAYVQLEK